VETEAEERLVTPASYVSGVTTARSSGLLASCAIRGGVSLFYLSRITGTSIAQLDATHGHLVPDSDEYVRSLMDAGDERRVQAQGR
jgi:hypothetical protein